MPDEKKIELPDNVRVRCPLVKFRLRQVKQCLTCENYAGLQAHIDNASKPFSERFTVACAYPTDRQLFELDED